MKTTVRVAIFIERPPEAVVAVILDPGRMTAWTTGLERFEVVAEAPGKTGSVALLHYREKGKPYVMKDELIDVEPDSRYVSRVTGDALTAEVETRLTSVEGGTRVEVRWSGTGKSFLLRLLLPLMRGKIARQALIDLEKLKALVEGSGI